MSTATLLRVPESPEEWSRWSETHRIAHTYIRQQLATKKNIQLTEYQLDPINPVDMQGWLTRNQETHVEENQALSLQSVDLESVNMQDANQRQTWFYLHWKNHQDAETAAGALTSSH